MKKKKFLKKEGGQALVEFALVLPLFMLILMGIIDFGWFFYNYIGVENSARNAARIACVEYQNTNAIYAADGVTPAEPDVNPETTTYYFSAYDVYKNKNSYKQAKTDSEGNDYILNQTTDIMDAAQAGVPSSLTLKYVKLTYSYDVDSATNESIRWSINNRYKGDAEVTVEATMRALTPVLGAFADDMKLTLKSTSTYKVEKAPAADDYA